MKVESILRLAQRYNGGFSSAGTWRSVIGRVIRDVSKGVVCFLLGDYPTSEFYMTTFWNNGCSVLEYYLFSFGILSVQFCNTSSSVLEYYLFIFGILSVKFWNTICSVLEYYPFSFGTLSVQFWNTICSFLEYYLFSFGILSVQF
jgi:hypothetical protein